MPGTKGNGKRSHKNFDSLDFYSVLEVARTATKDEIKKAYRVAVIRHHPDKNPDDVAGATKRCARINLAYETLSDDQKRAAYDADLPFKSLNSDSNSSLFGFPAEFSKGDFPWTVVFSFIFMQILEFIAFWFFSTPEPPDQSMQFNPEYYTSRNSQMGRAPGISTAEVTHYFAFVMDKSQPLNRFNLLANLFECLAFDERQWGSRDYPPTFGSASSAWADQVHTRHGIAPSARDFYDYWRSFETRKTFEWVKPYSRETRMSVRELWELNAHAQATARAEYNMIIKSIVNYLRLHDPRINSHKPGYRMPDFPPFLPKEPKEKPREEPHEEPKEEPKKQSRNQRKKQKANNKAKQKKSW